MLASRAQLCVAGRLFEADRLIAVEVVTPGGNWSSYPPHKHDEDAPVRPILEEIYYYEVAADRPARVSPTSASTARPSAPSMSSPRSARATSC